MANSIKLITVDLDDTLWECMPVIESAEQVLYDWLGKSFPKITGRYSLKMMRNRRFKLLERRPCLTHDLSLLRRESLRLHAKEFDYPEDAVSEKGFDVFIEARNRVTLFDGVTAVMEQLKKDYMLISLTNGNADVETIGISHWFDFSLSSAGVGKAKPHPAMFQEALRLSGIDSNHAVHVGDDPLHDVQGARQMGMKTVWVNHAKKTWPTHQQKADASIHYFSELPSLLESFS